MKKSVLRVFIVGLSAVMLTGLLVPAMIFADDSASGEGGSQGFSENVEVGNVMVSVTAPVGVFPDNSTLYVEQVSNDIAQDAVDQARPEDVNVALRLSYDIKVFDSDGNEVEPNTEIGNATVNFSTTQRLAACDDIDVYHVSGEDDSLSAQQMDASITNDEDINIKVETTSFSYYVVEFTYNDFEYVLDGESSVMLSTILSTLGISGNPSSVTFSDPMLVGVTQTDGDWQITALSAFTSDETLTILVGDETYVINVTDSGSLPGARSLSDSSGNVFLGGNYLEIGISIHGSFGTSSAPSSIYPGSSTGFHPYSSAIGLRVDGDGWNVGNSSRTGDFFLPGTPEERWMFGYYANGTQYNYVVGDRTSNMSGYWIKTPSVTNTSKTSSGQLSATVIGITQHNVKITITYSFTTNDKFFVTDVKIENNGSYNLTNVRYTRSFDPDQDAETSGSYQTYNRVACNPRSNDSITTGGENNFAMVVSKGSASKEAFFFIAFDERARASADYFAPSTCYEANLWLANTSFPTSVDAADIAGTSGYTLIDSGIALTFRIDTLMAGNNDTLTYYSSLDPDLSTSLTNVKKAAAGSLNYAAEEIAGLESNTDYTISYVNASNQTVRITINSGSTGSIKLKGTDKSGVAYDLAGQVITITAEGIEDQQMEVASRPTTPTIADDTASTPSQASIIITDSSITVQNAPATQEYSIDEGNNWTKPNSNNKVEFLNLNPSTDYVLYTRVSATETSPASEATNVTISSLNRAAVHAEGYVGVYDGNAHGIVVTSDSELTITYSLSGNSSYTSDYPTYTDVTSGARTVYFCVSGEGFFPIYGQKDVVITARPTVITCANQTITYGDNILDGTDFASASNLLDGETLTSISLTPSTLYATTSGRITASAPIIKSGDKDVTTNYSISYVNGLLTINTKAITIEANNQTIIYGNQIIQGINEVTVDGLVWDDKLTSISLTPSDTDVTYDGLITPGSAAIVNGSVNVKGNYVITYVQGNLTIDPREISIEWTNTIFTYDGSNHLPVATATGLVGEDECSISVVGVGVSAGRNAGTYVAQATDLDNRNYILPTEDTTKYRINCLPVEIVWDNVSLTFDGNVQVPTATVQNIVEGDECYVYVIGGNVNVGEYVATALTLSNSNYMFSKVEEEDYVINRAQAMFSDPTPINREFNGEEQELIRAGFTTDGKIVYAVNLKGEEMPLMVEYSNILPTAWDLGTYTVYYYVAGDSNHTNSEIYSFDVTITKGDMVYAAPESFSVSYTGSELLPSPVSVSVPMNARVTYSTSENGTYSWYLPTFTQSGSYTVYYKIEAYGYENIEGNYLFTIAPMYANTQATFGITFSTSVFEKSCEPELHTTNGIELVEGVDYKVTYIYNPEGGEGVAVITLMGNYAGTIRVPFEEPDYQIIYHDECSWNQDSNEGLSIYADGNIAKFIGVEVDGVLIDPSYYTAVSGSTEITLSKAFMDSLSSGKHTFSICYPDGKADTTFTINANPVVIASGESASMLIASIILVCSAVGAAIVGLRWRRDIINDRFGDEA